MLASYTSQSPEDINGLESAPFSSLSAFHIFTNSLGLEQVLEWWPDLPQSFAARLKGVRAQLIKGTCPLPPQTLTGPVLLLATTPAWAVKPLWACLSRHSLLLHFCLPAPEVTPGLGKLKQAACHLHEGLKLHGPHHCHLQVPMVGLLDRDLQLVVLQGISECIAC